MSPAKNPSFTSPPPIHFPFEIQIKRKKNKAAPKAAMSELVRGEWKLAIENGLWIYLYI